MKERVLFVHCGVKPKRAPRFIQTLRPPGAVTVESHQLGRICVGNNGKQYTEIVNLNSSALYQSGIRQSHLRNVAERL